MKGRICLQLCLVLIGVVLGGPAGAASGYQETVSCWRDVVARVAPYRQTLQDLYAEIERQTGPDKSRLNAEFSRRLGQQYPGSVFYGPFGRFAVNNYTALHFDSAWNINTLTQRFDGLTKTYDFRGHTLEIVNGPNRVKLRIDPARPERSQFLLAEIPAITATAQRVWTRKGIRQGIAQPLRDILNDTYAARISKVDGTRMDQLAEQMVEAEATRRYVLELAEEIYAPRTGTATPAGGSQEAAPPAPEPARARAGVQGYPSLLDLLPWYFWPALIGLGALRVAGTGRRRKARPRRGRTWERVGEFSLGRRKGHDSVPRPRPPWPAAPDKAPAVAPADSGAKPELPQEWSLAVLCALEWKRFETVCAEYLRLLGLDPRETRIGADGGVDIWVYRPGTEKPVGIVQCKAWTTYRVGVKPVRELFGVMAAEGVANGKFITSGEFTAEAQAFAQGKRLALISGERLLAAIRSLPRERQQDLLRIALEGDCRTPTCPQCGVKMTRRKGKEGGREFWGCPRYPRCRATLVCKD